VPIRVETPAETVGERLRRLRGERGLSQRELGEPGVSYAYISRIEAGARRPSVKALRVLARKLGVSPEYLETGVEIGEAQRRELELADAELGLRLEDDPAAARAQLARLLEEASAAGDLPAVTRARIGLGLAAAQEGGHSEAVAQLERVLASGLVTPLRRPDVYAALGRAYAALGEQPRAAALWEESLRRVAEEAPEDLALRTRFATYLSYALADLGQFERAQQVLREVLDAGSDPGDAYTQIRLYWALARLLALQGEPRAALEYAQRAIALLEATEDTLQLGRAHLLSAGILNLQGKGEEALAHLESAERAFDRGADAVDRASLRTEQAKAAVQLGNGEEAIARAREALALLEDEFVSAADAFGRALRLLAQQERWREASAAARSWGGILRGLGRQREALEVLEQAADFAARS